MMGGGEVNVFVLVGVSVIDGGVERGVVYSKENVDKLDRGVRNSEGELVGSMGDLGKMLEIV